MPHQPQALQDREIRRDRKEPEHDDRTSEEQAHGEHDDTLGAGKEALRQRDSSPSARART